MICSKCSELVLPVVCFDIDGTLGDYHGHFLTFAEGWLGVKPHYGTDVDHIDVWNDYGGNEPFREWFTRTYDVDVTTFRQVKLAYRQGGLKRTMPMFRYSASMVKSARNIAEVWLTTTRPWQRYDRIDPDTHEWLRRCGIQFDGVLYDEDKYAKLAERIDPARVVAVLEDEADQYDRAATLFGSWVPILRRNGYNKDVTRPNCADSAGKAENKIFTRYRNWRNRFEAA